MNIHGVENAGVFLIHFYLIIVNGFGKNAISFFPVLMRRIIVISIRSVKAHENIKINNAFQYNGCLIYCIYHLQCAMSLLNQTEFESNIASTKHATSRCHVFFIIHGCNLCKIGRFDPFQTNGS